MSTYAERLEADRALAAAVRDRIIAILDDLAAQETVKVKQCDPRHEPPGKYAYAAARLRQAKQLIIEGEIR